MKSPVDLVRITRLAKCCVFADTVREIVRRLPPRAICGGWVCWADWQQCHANCSPRLLTDYCQLIAARYGTACICVHRDCKFVIDEVDRRSTDLEPIFRGEFQWEFREVPRRISKSFRGIFQRVSKENIEVEYQRILERFKGEFFKNFRGELSENYQKTSQNIRWKLKRLQSREVSKETKPTIRISDSETLSVFDFDIRCRDSSRLRITTSEKL